MNNNEKELNILLTLVIADLQAKIKSGLATAADLKVALQLLKDNNIEALTTKDTPLGNLIETLPFEFTTNTQE